MSSTRQTTPRSQLPNEEPAPSQSQQKTKSREPPAAPGSDLHLCSLKPWIRGESRIQQQDQEAQRDTEQLCPLHMLCAAEALKTSSPAYVSKSLSPGSPSGRSVVLTKISSQSIQEAKAELREILLAKAVELRGEEERSLSHESLRAAFAIVSSITEEMSHMESDSGGSRIITEQGEFCLTRCPCLTQVVNKIKGFFTLCYAKFCDTLSRLWPGVCPGVSPELVMEKATPLLQELVSAVGDVYGSLPPSIIQGSFSELSETD